MSMIKLMWVVVVFLSGCYVEQSAEVKEFSSDKATPKLDPIRALVTLDETYGNRQTTIALDIELNKSQTGVEAKSVKINQLDSMGNPDPCPDILEEPSAYRSREINYAKAMNDYESNPITGTNFEKGDLVVMVKINDNSYHIESLMIKAGEGEEETLFSFVRSDNIENMASEGTIEVVEGRKNLSEFEEKYFGEDTSGSTSCDEEGSAPPENN